MEAAVKTQRRRISLRIGASIASSTEFFNFFTVPRLAVTSKMSTTQLLRVYVNQRLTVAVEEILEMFGRTINEYEEEIHRQRRLLGAEQLPATKIMLNNESGVSREIQPLIVNTKLPPEQQELSPSLHTEPPQPPCIKEEPEEVWIRQGIQGLEGDIPPVSVKSEDDEEKPQFSLLHQRQSEEHREAAQQTEAGACGENCGGSEPAFDLDVDGFLKATRDGQFFLSQCFKTETEDLDGDWNQMTESQPFSDSLKDNEAYKRSDNQKTLHKCPACGKTFKHNTALQRHITCHTGERPFDCAECGKTFRQKGSLHIHMRKHTGEKPFCCLVCGKNFTQSGTLAAHMRIHTGEKPFSCSVCKKRYNERGTLVRHMRVHTGEKPFTCSLCGKRFSEKGNLNKHKRVHTGEKPFSCSVCDKKFSLLSHLKIHKCPGETLEKALQLECPTVSTR
ncbi:zinc finger protein 239-like isoform X1 [Cottoperca gobio]|uniref:Zinc finger protein 239-like isoform X1 n=1 Tax=Cottoperca gobio TaxID=56716 RepID=A0A6J2PSK3_COTGO|nr:zinc finger protein 239-like isoform X1 [Cottoperca gobio]XP_029288307.1 zinc finger protein 239-like isoform X1 [Cottoperca gobio]XP_029288308.1 zinc finger protein 239-like isoform X1 [Cottoperca gobio]XP_029288309.1 zinc finger protein 239-like isoform X1 [Cottoperca gobio]